MIIVIDGYNVLKQIGKTSTIDNKDRNAFVMQLSAYAIGKKHSIILVFDGGQHDWAQSECVAGIQVVYSGTRQTADDYIYAYIKKHTQKEVLLVSSDGALSVMVAGLGVPSIESGIFYQIIKGSLYRKQELMQKVQGIKNYQKSIKLHDDTSAEFDAYMEEASQNIPVKSENSYSNQEYGHHKLSRHERNLLKIIKKLL